MFCPAGDIKDLTCSVVLVERSALQKLNYYNFVDDFFCEITAEEKISKFCEHFTNTFDSALNLFLSIHKLSDKRYDVLQSLIFFSAVHFRFPYFMV